MLYDQVHLDDRMIVVEIFFIWDQWSLYCKQGNPEITNAMASTQQVAKRMIEPLHVEGLILWLNDAPVYGERYIIGENATIMAWS